jgi:3D (Asp-Asp-Asp) domain-containing protein
MRSRIILAILIAWCVITPILSNFQFNNFQENKNEAYATNKNFSLIKKPIIINTLTPTLTPTITTIIKPTIDLSSRSDKKLNYKTDKMTFRISAYDLSVASCGKSRSNKNFGQTRSGYNLANKNRVQSMTIAADLNILPMGTKVYIEFKNDSVGKYNGIYTVRDTGGAIHGYKLDLFMGDGSYDECMQFGVQMANVRIIENE